MYDSEDYFLNCSDMDDTEIEKTLEKQAEDKQIDTFLAYTAERMFHSGGTPPIETDNIPPANVEISLLPQVLFHQPKINGVKCPLRKCNYNKPQRKIEKENFLEFYQTLDKEEYNATQLAKLYSIHFTEITPKDLGRLKVIKQYFSKKRIQKKTTNDKGISITIDRIIYHKKV